MGENEPSCARGAVHGNVLVITVMVEQLRDAKTSYALRDEMLRLVEEAKTNRVVIDLKNVAFLGSIGLLALLAVRRRLEGGRIVICNMSYAIRSVFDLCRLIAEGPSATAPFEAESSLDAALDRLSKESPTGKK